MRLIAVWEKEASDLIGAPMMVTVIPTLKVNRAEKKRINAILSAVCNEFGIELEAFYNGRKFRSYADARAIAAHILFDRIANITVYDIAEIFNKSRSTVIHMMNRCNNLMQSNEQFTSRYNAIVLKINQL